MRFIQEYLNLPYLKIDNSHFGRSTVNFEKIEGGLYLSAVPDECLACVDSRLIPDTPPQLVQKQVDALINEINKSAPFKVIEREEPPEWRRKQTKYKAEALPARHPLIKRMAKAVKDATGKDAVIAGFPGMTITTAALEQGIPSVVCGPGSLMQAHTADEWIDTEQIVKACRIYTALMTDM